MLTLALNKVTPLTLYRARGNTTVEKSRCDKKIERTNRHGCTVCQINTTTGRRYSKTIFIGVALVAKMQ